VKGNEPSLKISRKVELPTDSKKRLFISNRRVMPDDRAWQQLFFPTNSSLRFDISE
jgi:hypothetical protein